MPTRGEILADRSRPLSKAHSLCFLRDAMHACMVLGQGQAAGLTIIEVTGPAPAAVSATPVVAEFLFPVQH